MVVAVAAGAVNPAARIGAMISVGGKMSVLGCQLFSGSCWEDAADAKNSGGG